MFQRLMLLGIFVFGLATTATAQEGYAPVRNGQLYYEVKGEGTPIIMLHDGPGFEHSYFLPQFDQLTQSAQVIFYDQRGSGRSLPTDVDSSLITMGQFVDDLEKLRQHLGHEKVILLGHSWGGLLAMQYATRYPEHLNGLILVESMPATAKGHAAFEKNIAKRVQPMKRELASLKHNSEFNYPNLFNHYCRLIFATYVDRIYDLKNLSLNFSTTTAQNQPRIEARFVRNFLGKSYDLRPALKEIYVPTLVVHATKDPIPLWTAHEIADAMPMALLVIIEKSGHFPFVEQTDQFFEVLGHFIRTV